MGHSSQDHNYLRRASANNRNSAVLPPKIEERLATRGDSSLEKPATNGSFVLPSFFVIGPPRTGTSWLHEVLSKRVSLSHPTKETRFFDKHFDRGLEWYASHYRKA